MEEDKPKKTMTKKEIKKAVAELNDAIDYLQKTSRTDVTWRELLDRPYEPCR